MMTYRELRKLCARLVGLVPEIGLCELLDDLSRIIDFYEEAQVLSPSDDVPLTRLVGSDD